MSCFSTDLPQLRYYLKQSWTDASMQARSRISSHLRTQPLKNDKDFESKCETVTSVQSAHTTRVRYLESVFFCERVTIRRAFHLLSL